MPEPDQLASFISRFGAATKAKLSALLSGAPEDQLRAPLEALIKDLAGLALFRAGAVVPVGETTLAHIRTRPDYAIHVSGALVGFIEVKAPGKGADPRRFRDDHDRRQWERLQSLPNLIYTDGNAFSLWRDGKLATEIVHLEGDVETSGARLSAPPALARLFADFFRWEPVAPRSPLALANITARLCRYLRDDVAEQVAAGSPSLTGLAEDWRRLLFPEASDEQFADGYAQAVTFGLLMARAQNITLHDGLDRVAKALSRTNTIIGTALRALTDDPEGQEALKTPLGTLTRVLDAVDWAVIAKGDPEAWLYFYEHFLAVYDNALRKKTGSYYTPHQVVTAMVRLVDETLRHPARFAVPTGLAAPDVTLADPAMGTGTFLLGALRHIAEATRADQGPGAVPLVIQESLQRLIGFELQFGPFAVAQLRLLAEVADLMATTAPMPGNLNLRLYITNTLGNPYEEEEYIPQILRPLAASRREANTLKRGEPITVVIGNPPYKEKARGRGAWVETDPASGELGILERWMPPNDWGLGVHTKHLRNLYVYFWRWATWKVFGDDAASPQAAADRKGIVSFITVAGFLNGPGFQGMRADLRASADAIWIIDCSPDGHRPEVATRIFEDVQQPVCIVIAARWRASGPSGPAEVRYTALPVGNREKKFTALAALPLDGPNWSLCAPEPRAPFLPEATGTWANCASLDDLFVYNGSGVMPGRTWVISPDRPTLQERWMRLVSEAEPERKEFLFHPHMRNGQYGDKYAGKVVHDGLHGYPHRPTSVALDDCHTCTTIRYGFRTFDRQWLIADARLINQANPALWDWHSDKQVYLTAPHDRTPTTGPAISFTGCIPDLHHYAGRGGRAYPLLSGADGATGNVAPDLTNLLKNTYRQRVEPADLLAYVAALAAHPGYTARFAVDLVQPGLRIPITADTALFQQAISLGQEIIWLHTFGERFIDHAAGRPLGAPRLPEGNRPTIPVGGAIPTSADAMPDTLRYESATRRLHLGTGYIDNVSPEMWAYEVSGKQILVQWFSYRRRNRERPLIGDRRPPSPLGDIQPQAWLAEYTRDLIDLLNVLGRLVALEPQQRDLLDAVCAGPLIPSEQIRQARATAQAPASRRRPASARQTQLPI